MPRLPLRGRRRPRVPHPNAAPPKPVKIVAPVLDIAGLTTAYEWLLLDKSLGFRLAFEWYTNNAAALLHGGQLDEAGAKLLEKATKSKALGDSSDQPYEKENAWRRALIIYEKIWAGKNLPKIDDALASAATPGVMVTACQTVLSNLNAAYNSLGIQFKIRSGTERDLLESEILLPQSDIISMVAAPPIKAVLGEALTVAKAISIVTTDGQSQLDYALFLANLPRAIDAATAWALTASKLTQPVAQIKTPRAARAPRDPNAPRAPQGPSFSRNGSKIIRVLDLSRATKKGNRGTVINLMSDGQTIAEYKAALTAVNLGGMAGWALTYATSQSAITIEG